MSAIFPVPVILDVCGNRTLVASRRQLQCVDLTVDTGSCTSAWTVPLAMCASDLQCNQALNCFYVIMPSRLVMCSLANGAEIRSCALPHKQTGGQLQVDAQRSQ